LKISRTGIDTANPSGTPLTAPWSGRVDVATWSDNVGNMFEIQARYQFEGKQMPAGFGYGSMHMTSLSVTAGNTVGINTLLGYSGNTGAMVVGTPGDHNHFTIFNNAYGNNRYLTELLKADNSNSWKENGKKWVWPVDPNANRRFYDPETTIYQRWFRR
jgi:murein DD-endopeptidase MepM/ murein hydrolase activator NlpD